MRQESQTPARRGKSNYSRVSAIRFPILTHPRSISFITKTLDCHWALEFELAILPAFRSFLVLILTGPSTFNDPSPTIVDGPQDITAFADDHADLHFNCSTLHANKKVTWYFKPAEPDSNWTWLNSTDNGEQALRFPASEKLLPSDEGFYRCVANAERIGAVVSRPARLTLASESIFNPFISPWLGNYLLLVLISSIAVFRLINVP